MIFSFLFCVAVFWTIRRHSNFEWLEKKKKPPQKIKNHYFKEERMENGGDDITLRELHELRDSGVRAANDINGCINVDLSLLPSGGWLAHNKKLRCVAITNQNKRCQLKRCKDNTFYCHIHLKEKLH